MISPVLLAAAFLGLSGAGLLLAGRRVPPRLGARVALGISLFAALPYCLSREVLLLPVLLQDTGSGFDALARAFSVLGGLLTVGLLVWMALGSREDEARAAPWLLLFHGVFLYLLSRTNLLLLYASWEGMIFLTYVFLSQRRAELPVPGIAEWFLGLQHLAGYPMLAALVLIHRYTGTLDYGRLAIGDVPPEALSLLLGTVWLRAAQVPFQGWLLSTAGAPAPAGVLLQGGWLLLVGPYSWLRLLSRVAAPPPQEAALIVGSLSLLLGGILALRQETGPRVLAADTVARAGLLWMALGLGGAWGVAGALFLLLDLVAGKLLLHLAFSGEGVLDGGVRRAFYALGMWGALGLPPSAGFLGRWLLALGLLLARHLPYLAVVLLSTPFLLAGLWRGWTLVPSPEAAAGSPAVRTAGVVLALSVPLSGLLASPLWRTLFERVGRATVSASALLVRNSLERLGPWAPASLFSLLLLGAGALWCGCFRRRGGALPEPTVTGPLREPLPVLYRDTAWPAWVAQPVALYRGLVRLGYAIAAWIERAVRFLERHTTYFLLFVLIAAGAAVVALTR